MPDIYEKYGFTLGALSNIKTYAASKNNKEILKQIQRISDFTGHLPLDVSEYLENNSLGTTKIKEAEK